MKNLDESSFSIQRNVFDGLTTEEEFLKYLQANGYQYRDGKTKENWYWARAYVAEYNYATHDDLIAEQLAWLRKEWNKIPGGESSNGLSIEGYNQFARWDLWKGGYVKDFGFIPEPASSEYGSSIYLGSWYAKGTETNPLTPAKFYQLTQQKMWFGGIVKGWGNVSEEKRVLGASSSGFYFINTPENQVALCNIANLLTELGFLQTDIEHLKTVFKDFWDASRNSYEIDDKSLRTYLNSQLDASPVNDIKEALDLHYGVLLREITRTVEKNGETLRYGTDYLIVDYNPFLHLYSYINPRYLTVGTLDERVISSGSIPTVNFIYYNRNYLRE